GTLATHAAQQSPLDSEAPVPPVEGPALLVIGSGSGMAQRRIAYLRQHQLVAALEHTATLPAHAAGDILLHLAAPPPGTAMDGPAARELADQIAATASPRI